MARQEGSDTNKPVDGTWVVRIRCGSRHGLIYNAIPRKKREMRDGGQRVRARVSVMIKKNVQKKGKKKACSRKEQLTQNAR